jgi:Tat protein translocase TatC
MWQAALSKLFKVREKVALNLNTEDEEKPFLDHLEDLRKMFVRIIITLLISVFATFAFNRQLTDLVQQPYVWAMNGVAASINADVAAHPEAHPADRPAFSWKMPGTIKPQEGFMASVNVSMVSAVIVSFPLLLLFLLQFILPGLRKNERQTLWPALGIGFGLFLTGVTFSYYSVLPRALQFFAEWNYQHGFETIWMLGDYITFSTRFILIFGISFELPVVVMALVKLDFLSFKTMSGTRKHALIGIAVFSAVITPTQDILTLLLLAGPLYVLYEICIWLAWFLEKKERQAYPEFYAERDKDEAELEKEVDDWDKDGYTPWFSETEDDDIEDEYQQRAKTGTTPPPSGEPNSEAAPDAKPDSEPGSGSDSASPVASKEKTLEELAREDEQRGTEAPDAPLPGSEPDSTPGDPSRNQD